MHAVALLFSAASLGAPADVDALAWLAGHWRAADGRSEEFWLAPAAGQMAGLGRQAGRSGTSVEFLRIVERNGRLYYIALPDGQARTEFQATEATDGTVRFANAGHDFPTWIRYRRTAADALEACVGDASRERCWQWRRVHGGSAPP